jgi:hypothetical protein
MFNILLSKRKDSELFSQRNIFFLFLLSHANNPETSTDMNKAVEQACRTADRLPTRSTLWGRFDETFSAEIYGQNL